MWSEDSQSPRAIRQIVKPLCKCAINEEIVCSRLYGVEGGQKRWWHQGKKLSKINITEMDSGMTVLPHYSSGQLYVPLPASKCVCRDSRRNWKVRGCRKRGYCLLHSFTKWKRKKRIRFRNGCHQERNEGVRCWEIDKWNGQHIPKYCHVFKQETSQQPPNLTHIHKHTFPQTVVQCR